MGRPRSGLKTRQLHRWRRIILCGRATSGLCSFLPLSIFPYRHWLHLSPLALHHQWSTVIFCWVPFPGTAQPQAFCLSKSCQTWKVAPVLVGQNTNIFMEQTARISKDGRSAQRFRWSAVIPKAALYHLFIPTCSWRDILQQGTTRDPKFNDWCLH